MKVLRNKKAFLFVIRPGVVAGSVLAVVAQCSSVMMSIS